ncbi:magnesium/cobalt transporter CorA [Noviherbaspirillum sedimenti]|uniref:Magnesium transport protein CorA n=1 Tax=Noviherbaspirillum sedimenti TaxID=2320865 RepID=A0A3A3G623_9BURK|nr:magnesium/cobalt transporter CorA [Noviherbaspirillum sedimenti]RJG03977.1 magnesium and cobalt transport protein CorA [Noviherbaspirillum sedimenti]
MLINCAAYQKGRKIADIPVDKISSYIARGDCFVWVALKDAEPAELDVMRQEFGLHELAVEDAHHGHQSPKVEEYGSSMFIVVKTVELVEGALQVGELDIFIGENYVLSVRSHSHQDFLGVRARAEREPHLLSHGPAFVVYALMDAVVDRYFPVIEALEAELEEIEDRMFEQASERSNIERLYQLKRKVTVLKHVVSPLMESAGKLFGGRVPPLFEHSQNYFRDVYDHLYRINNSIEAIRDTVNTAIQVNLSMVAIDESVVNKRLAAWAAIFAVATAFAGIWGMNFKAMPELDWKYGYPTALVLMTTVCGYLYIRFRKARWL